MKRPITIHSGPPDSFCEHELFCMDCLGILYIAQSGRKPEYYGIFILTRLSKPIITFTILVVAVNLAYERRLNSILGMIKKLHGIE